MAEKNKEQAINEFIEDIVKNQTLRREITTKSHLWFFYIYLSHHVEYKIAPFQKEMFAISEDTNSFLSVIVAFRGSAKSTIMTLSYPLWAILGKQQKKFIVIVSQTQDQARIHFRNLKKELEENKLLKSDLGPFREENEWNSSSLIIPKYNAKITAVSGEQSIRGKKHGQYRPDLIILDDVEDSASVRTKEGRDKTYSWFTREIIPLGDKNTRIVVVGNLLHEDSLIKRLGSEIKEDKRNGIYKEYPIMDDNNNALWSDKYPNIDSIETEKKNTGDTLAWLREYMLKIVSDKGQIVKPEWPHYYDEIPQSSKASFRFIALGVDLAISKNESADYTAIVLAKVFSYGDGIRIYILPHLINDKLDFPEALETIKTTFKTFSADNTPVEIFVEDCGYQRSMIEQLVKEGYPAEGVKVAGQDKKARLTVTTPYIKMGKIKFPRKGAEELIEQLTGFGIEKHDDLADAFANLIIKIIEKNYPLCRAWPNKPKGW